MNKIEEILCLAYPTSFKYWNGNNADCGETHSLFAFDKGGVYYKTVHLAISEKHIGRKENTF